MTILVKKVFVMGLLIIFLGSNLALGNENNVSQNIKKNLVTLGDELDQQQNFYSGAAELGLTDYNFPFAQSFIPQKAVLTRIFLYVERIGQPYPFDLAIRKDLNGENLTTVSVNYNSIPVSLTWIEFNFSDIPVVIGETYYIIMSTQSKQNNIYGVGTGNGDPYANGSAWVGDWVYWTDDTTFDFCFKTYGKGKPPYKPAKPNGKTKGNVNDELIFSSSTTDPDGDQIYYNWYWGDDTYSGWIGPFNSGDIIETNHTWDKKGVYKVKIKAKDFYGAESDWSDPLSVIIPRTRTSYSLLLLRFLEWFPLLKRIL